MLVLAALALVAAAPPEAHAPAELPDAVVHHIDADGDVAVHVRVARNGHGARAANGATLTLSGDKLVVHAPARTAGEQPSVVVTVPDLASVRARGAARVEVTGYSGRALSLSAGGASSITLAGRSAGRLAVEGRGTAHVDADQVEAAAADVDLADAARAEVRVSDRGSLRCTLKRASRLTLSGHPRDVKKTVEGVARLVNAR